MAHLDLGDLGDPNISIGADGQPLPFDEFSVAGRRTCNKCEKEYRNQKAMKAHFNEKHQKSNSYGFACGEGGCLRQFATEQYMLHHRRLHRIFLGLSVEQIDNGGGGGGAVSDIAAVAH